MYKRQAKSLVEDTVGDISDRSVLVQMKEDVYKRQVYTTVT